MSQLLAEPQRWLQLVALGLCLFLGLAHLAVSQAANWRRVTGSPSVSRPAARRLFGVALLVCSLTLALWRDGFGFGLLLWLVAVQAVGVAVALGLTLRPRWLGRLALAPSASQHGDV